MPDRRPDDHDAAHTLTVRIDHADDPITGLVEAGQRSWRFTGWLELAAALSAAFDSSREKLPHPAGDHGACTGMR